ncbi:MAG: hypothetical protein JWP86_2764 [Phenylobacterium sp.]|nr:hypothetical protein [Phenylobacterium sp.]
MTQSIIGRAAAGLMALLLGAATSAAAPEPAAKAPTTVNMQGDEQSWINDPHMHAFYDLTVAAFAAGPAKVDQAAFQTKSFALFAAFGASRGVKPEAMVDHLKLIPGQVVQIAKDDPDVLKSYPNFVAAVFGPQ